MSSKQGHSLVFSFFLVFLCSAIFTTIGSLLGGDNRDLLVDFWLFPIGWIALLPVFFVLKELLPLMQTWRIPLAIFLFFVTWNIVFSQQSILFFVTMFSAAVTFPFLVDLLHERLGASSHQVFTRELLFLLGVFAVAVGTRFLAANVLEFARVRLMGSPMPGEVSLMWVGLVTSGSVWLIRWAPRGRSLKRLIELFSWVFAFVSFQLAVFGAVAVFESVWFFCMVAAIYLFRWKNLLLACVPPIRRFR